MTLENTEHKISSALQEAAEWFASLEDDTTPANRERWQAWINKNADNQAAWARVQAIDEQFRRLPSQPAREALEKAGTNRRNLIKSLGVLAVAVPIGVVAYRALPLSKWQAEITTAVGEVKEGRLPDGSRFWLDTDSAISLNFTEEQREIELVAGAIRIQTVKDNRPLNVRTADGVITPVGTDFSVRFNRHNSHVAVTEGRVVLSTSISRARTVVHRGEAIEFTADSIEEKQPASSFDLHWKDGILVAENQNLGEFLDRLARYRPGFIFYDDHVSQHTLVGSFPIRDTDVVLAALEDTFPIKVTKITPWWVKVETLQAQK